MSGTDYDQTPNLGLYKPRFNADVGNWGTHWNANADTLDSKVSGMSSPVTATGSTTPRTVQDRFAEVVNVKDFGALGVDGSQNATAAFNAAIAAASATNSKTVLVPTGFYALDPITIPEGVLLMGDVPGPADPRPGFLTHARGATLFVNSYASPFITLQRSAGLQDVMIYDRGQVAPTAAAPNVCPAQILMADCSRVRRVTLINAYIGIQIRSGRCIVEDCYIGAYKIGVDVDQVQDVTYLCNVWCGAFYDTALGLFPYQSLDSWVMANNGVGFQFGRADGISMVNCGTYIKWTSIYLTDGTPAGANYGWCANHNADDCIYGVAALSTNSVGWRFNGMTVLPTQHAGLQAVTPLYLASSGAYAPVVGWIGGSNGVTSYWTNPNPLVNAGTAIVRGVSNVPDTGGTVGGNIVVQNAPGNAFLGSFKIGDANSMGLWAGAGTLYFGLANPAGTPTASLTTMTSAGNWAISGTLATAGAATLGSLSVTGATALGGTATVTNGSVLVKNAPGNAFVGSMVTAGAQSLGMWSDGNTLYFGTATNAGVPTAGVSSMSAAGNWNLGNTSMGNAGFHGTGPIAKPTVTGAKGGNAALASLMTALAAYGLVTDSTT